FQFGEDDFSRDAGGFLPREIIALAAQAFFLIVLHRGLIFSHKSSNGGGGGRVGSLFGAAGLIGWGFGRGCEGLETKRCSQSQCEQKSIGVSHVVSDSVCRWAFLCRRLIVANRMRDSHDQGAALSQRLSAPVIPVNQPEVTGVDRGACLL